MILGGSVSGNAVSGIAMGSCEKPVRANPVDKNSQNKSSLVMLLFILDSGCWVWSDADIGDKINNF